MKPALTELVLPKLPVPEFIATAKEAGFESVELAVRNSSEFPFSYSTTDEQLKTFSQASRELGLPIDSITISNASGHLLLPPDQARDAIAETIWALECGARLGATAALHTLGRCTPDLFYEDAYQNAIANLKTLAPVCERLHIALAVEFIWSGFLFSPLEMRRLLETVGSPDVGFYFDSGNMAIFQYPQHWVRALGPHIKRVHLKDFTGGPGKNSWPGLLKGSVDFHAVMAELRRAGYDGPLVSEVSISDQPLAETAAAIREIMTY